MDPEPKGAARRPRDSDGLGGGNLLLESAVSEGTTARLCFPSERSPPAEEIEESRRRAAAWLTAVS